MTHKIPEYDGVEILLGDSRDILPKLEARSIQCCVTSPPYWGLRDYDHSAQIGTESSPEEYVENLVEIFREVRRVLADDGTFWLNVGDGYARNGGTGNCGPNAQVGNTKKLIQRRNCTVPDCWGLKDRDLMGLPWRVAFALQADGWLLRSKITWVKCRRASKIVPQMRQRRFSCSRKLQITTTTIKPSAKKPAQISRIIGYWDPMPVAHPIPLFFQKN